MRVFDYASPLELAWTLLAVFGWVRFYRRVTVAMAARSAIIRARRNGALKLVATSRIQGYLFKMLVFESWSAAGLLACTLPNGPTTDLDGPYALYGLVISVLLVVSMLLLLVWGEVEERNHRKYSRLEQVRVALQVAYSDSATELERSEARRVIDEIHDVLESGPGHGREADGS